MNDYISREAAIGFSDRVIERDDSDTNPVVVSFIAYRAFLRELPAVDVLTRQEVVQTIREASQKAYADAQGSIFGQQQAKGMMAAAKLFEGGMDNA